MFQLRDRTRRRICIAAFFPLCVLPTVVVCGWCVTRHLPAHVTSEARRLTGQLGLDVSLRGLQHLRPGVVRYEGLELADLETGGTLLRCPLLEARWTGDAHGQGPRRPALVLIASEAEIDSAAFGQLGQLLHRVLQRPIGRPQVDVRLSCGEVSLRSDDSSQSLTELHGSIEHLEGGSQARVSFRLASDAAPQDAPPQDASPQDTAAEPIKIRIVRNRQTTPPTSGFELDTGGGAVPCSLLAKGIPLLSPLGPHSRFLGYLWANQVSDGGAPAQWHGEMAGRLLDVDLGALVTGRFPHKLSGIAQVTIHSARFRQPRLEEALGELVLGPGLISRSLIDAAHGQLNLVRAAAPETPGELVPYEQLAVAFLIDAEGLKLQGRCPGAEPGTILVDRHGPLLGQPLVQPQPVVALLRTLVPASDVQVPASRQTDWLIHRLPVPQVIYPEGS